MAWDTFEVDGVSRPHVCIVHEPLSLSLRDICGLVGGKFPQSFVKPMVVPILLALIIFTRLPVFSILVRLTRVIVYR